MTVPTVIAGHTVQVPGTGIKEQNKRDVTDMRYPDRVRTGEHNRRMHTPMLIIVFK